MKTSLSGPTGSLPSSTRRRRKQPTRRPSRSAKRSRSGGRDPDGQPARRRRVLRPQRHPLPQPRRSAAQHGQLIKAQPFLGTLAADPTLRGILGAVSQSLEGVRLKKTTLEDMRPAVTAIADALDLVAEGKHPAFSWRRLITGRAPEPSDLRRFVNIQPILDYGALEPGGKATKVIRATIAELGLTPDRGVKVRLTGSVALSDEEFATVADGAALNGVVTILVVLLILWLALKQARIILAVLVNLAVGLTFTAAIGLGWSER